MTATVHPLHLVGRWRRGFAGDYLYLLRDAAKPDRVKLGTTKDPRVRLAALQDAGGGDLSYVAVLPGNGAHKAYMARRFAEDRICGNWYRREGPLAFARQVQRLLADSRADTGREAMLEALAALDPAIADLQRLWRNGTPTATIAELGDTTPADVDERIRRLRAMGFDLTYRYAGRFRSAA